ncbi:MAG: Fis family transcriptional regulator [Acidobacteria bacterium RIFCSPLOWO2_02_FULL_68_18]|nr:MAG: Fis family transcriptional regulator [Acidobacteria bacterium RIFCSPLOWO2_02_FULL_68_18]OFW49919.1 MAG: Fis family transcriptional regulator [Acidobacteria bacterium RIFCSPLOWO2_12_FULL_68_19]
MILEYEGYGFMGAASGQEGLALLERERPDLVLLDIKMPGMDGMEVLRTLRELDDGPPVVMISGHGTTSTAVEAVKSGAVDFLDKPLGSERVIVTLQNALKQQGLRRENRALRLAMESKYEIVGRSPALRAVLEAVARAAPTGATVLLLGESGVGKELVARTIHRNSPRAGQRFVQVNCAAIPEELIESELFGHEKGSFTGATEKQIGKFEQADRGTIFLDEVADMSARTQAKVLRVLEEQEVERIGSARTIEVDVRVVAATNRNLEEMIQRGEFREDLYFRLSVIPIVVPPLRERREDIPLLVQHFAQRTGEEHNLKPKQFDSRAMDALQRHGWRGNIRELRNTVERVMIMTPGDLVRIGDLPQEVRGEAAVGAAAVEPGPPGAAASSAGPAASLAAGTLREFKDASERAFLVQKLRENHWNISKTAEVIDTPRSNLYKKLEQYGISQDADG